MLYGCGHGLNGRVRRVMGEIKEERLFVRTLHDAESLVGEAIGEVLARLAEFQVRHVAEFRAVPTTAAVGPKERLRRAPLRSADIHVEAVCLGSMFGVAEVPLAN